MPKLNVGAFAGVDGASSAPTTPEILGVARGMSELYTPPKPGSSVIRNVIFIVDPPTTDEQHKSAMRYEAKIMHSLTPCAAISRTWPDRAFTGTVVPIPITPEGHTRIREAVTGVVAAPSETPYR
jgi:hypothetical protein